MHALRRQEDSRIALRMSNSWQYDLLVRGGLPISHARPDDCRIGVSTVSSFDTARRTQTACSRHSGGLIQGSQSAPKLPHLSAKYGVVHEGRNVASASGRGDGVPSTVASRREAGELPAAAAHSWHPCLGVGGNSGHGPCKPSHWRLCVSALRLL